jgi:hypothetical protein
MSFPVIARSDSDDAIQPAGGEMDCFVALAMTMTPSHHHHHGIFDQRLERADQFGAERTIDRAMIA